LAALRRVSHNNRSKTQRTDVVFVFGFVFVSHESEDDPNTNTKTNTIWNLCPQR